MNKENKYKRKVLIHVLWNIQDQQQESTDKREDLKKKLEKIKGIKEGFFTEGSEVSDIAAIAEWTIEETYLRIQEIINISNVRDVDIRILVPA